MVFARIQRWVRVGAAVAAAAALFAQTARPEEELRAALILGFARFSVWNGVRDSGLPKENPIVIAVLQHPGLAGALERAASGKLINGRPVQVRPVRTAAQAAGCQMLYVGRLPAAKLEEALREAPAAALTIGEDERFLAFGGAVHLFEEDGRISFEVNLTALQTAGVTISSKLLRLGYTQRAPAKGRVAP